tara:strand:+ start:129 stop:287 length:159 start_codon:yes stop_codon:yes gene_type:complete
MANRKRNKYLESLDRITFDTDDTTTNTTTNNDDDCTCFTSDDGSCSWCDVID